MIKQKKTARAGHWLTVQTDFRNTVSLCMWLDDTDELAIRGMGCRNTPPCAITFTCAFDCDANHARTSVLTWLRRNAWSTHTNEITDGLLGVLLVLLHGNTPSCLRHYAASRTQSSIHAHEKPRRHGQQQRAGHWRAPKKQWKKQCCTLLVAWRP